MDKLDSIEIGRQESLLESLSTSERLVDVNLENNKLSRSQKVYYESVKQNIEGAKGWIQSYTAKKTVELVIELGLAVGMLSACSQVIASNSFESSQESNTPTPTLGFIPISESGTPTPDHDDLRNAEMTRVAPLSTPGAIDSAIKATSQAVGAEGWESMVKRGFPEKAINSVVQIDLFDSESGNCISGSGNLMHINGYWIVLTVAHAFYSPSDMLQISRPNGFDNNGETLFLQGEYGVAIAPDEQFDFGVIVIPDEIIESKDENVFNEKTALKLNDLAFYKDLPDVPFYGVSFPSLTSPNPTVSFGSRIAEFAKPIRGAVVLADNLSKGGSSGGGEFAKIGDEFLYIGPIWSTIDHPVFLNSTLIFNIGELGRSGFDELIKTAIDNYQVKQNK